MKYRTKHRIGTVVIGIAIILLTQALIPLVLESKTPLVFAGFWLAGMIIGIGAIYLAIKPPKYEFKYCTTCGKETQQFQTGPVYREGLKPQILPTPVRPATLSEENKRNIIGHAYVCETCGKSNIVRLAASTQPEPTTTFRALSPPMPVPAPEPRTAMQQGVPSAGVKYCVECGRQIPEVAVYCPKCASRQS